MAGISRTYYRVLRDRWTCVPAGVDAAKAAARPILSRETTYRFLHRGPDVPGRVLVAARAGPYGLVANVRRAARGGLLCLFLIPRGRLARNKNLDLKFDSKAWIGLDFIDDLVLAGDEILQDRPTAFHHEFAHLVEIERYELLDLEDVDAISKADIFSQRLRDRRPRCRVTRTGRCPSLRLSLQRWIAASQATS